MIVPPTDLEDDEVELQEGEGEGDAPARGGSKIVIWLVICGLAVLFLPLYVISTTVKNTNDKLSTDLDSIQATLSATPPVSSLQQTLSAQFLDMQNQSKAVGSIRSTLMASHINWPTVMATIGAYDTNQMAVNNVDQISTGIRITGRAKQEIVAMAYADMLRASGLFDTVAVESINLQSVIITVTPMATASPTPPPAITATPAPPNRNQATATPVPTIEIKVTDFIISVTMKKETTADGRST
jgi:hypothetical protein